MKAIETFNNTNSELKRRFLKKFSTVTIKWVKNCAVSLNCFMSTITVDGGR